MIFRPAFVAVLVAVCAGCATGARENDSRAVATTFLAAMGDHDTAAACALLAADTRDQLEYAEGEPCATSLESVDIAGGAVDTVDVWGDRAQARASTGTLFLVELDSGWRIAAAACARSAEGTYDCLLGA